jgi:hypothetical protein
MWQTEDSPTGATDPQIFRLPLKSDLSGCAVIRGVVQNDNNRRCKMTESQETFAEERTLGVAVLLYYAVALGAFVIGMYGLFNLVWLAGSAVEQNARTLAGL